MADDTEHLLASRANRSRLLRSVAEADARVMTEEKKAEKCPYPECTRIGRCAAVYFNGICFHGKPKDGFLDTNGER